MTKVKVGELRNNLSKYLKKVRHGGQVVITDRETPIGRLVPYETKSDEESFEMVEPHNGWGGLAKMKFSATKYSGDIVDLLLEDRKKR